MQDNVTISLIELFEKFPNNEAARCYIEEHRWNGKPVCPHCGAGDNIWARTGKRIGYYRCNDCGEEFTVRTGTIFERSRVPLHKWIAAIYFTVTERKGISSLQLSKQIGVTQKTAWFMQVRIREACGNGSGTLLSGIVEADETYIGGKETNKHISKKIKAGRGTVGKQPIMGMRQRGGNTIALPVEKVDQRTVTDLIHQGVEVGSKIYTDEASAYKHTGGLLYEHETVNHSAGEYVGPNDIHTNGIESVWAVLKRGLYGVWHHASTKHIHRYVNEATFRLNEGNVRVHTRDRIDAMLSKAIGKRVTYREATA